MVNVFDQFVDTTQPETQQPQPASQNAFDQFDEPADVPGSDTVLAGSVPGNDATAGELTRSIVGQGLALGFGDEIEAFVRSTVGPESFDEAITKVRGEIKAFQERNPGLAITTEIAGALIPAILTGGQSVPASIGGQAAKFGLQGAAIGGALGFGKGEGVEDRLQGAAVGAGTGGVAGAVAPAVVAGGQRLAGAVVNPLRGAVNAEAEASRRVATAINRDAALPNSNQLSAQQITQAQNVGQPVTNLERGGEATRALARDVSNKSPEARAVLNSEINARFEGQGQRITERLEQLTGGAVRIRGKTIQPAGNQTLTDAIKTEAVKLNRPAYRKAYKDGDKPLQSDELNQLLSLGPVSEAAKRAAKSAPDRSVLEGFGAFNPKVVVEDGIIKFPRGANGLPQFPNLQYWDSVKRELDDIAEVAVRRGGNNEASIATQAAQRLRNELDRLVPSYKKTRAQAASFFEADDAVKAGSNFVRGSQDLREARKALAKMNPAEKELFAKGFRERFVQEIESVSDRSDVVRRIWGNKRSRDKIAIALGPKRARELEAFTTVETVMDFARGAVQGNSTTARQLIEGFSVGVTGAGLTTGDFTSPTALLVGTLTGLGRVGAVKIDRRVAQRIAEKLISSDPRVFQQGIQRVARSPKLLGNLRLTVGQAARVSGGPVGQNIGEGISDALQENTP